MSTKQLSKKEYREKAVYVGRRVMPNGKVMQVFEQMPSKRQMFFTGIRGVWIGYTYMCAEDSISIKPERTTDPIIQNPEWEALDVLVDRHNQKKRAEAKIRKVSKAHVTNAVEALQPLVKNLSFFDRRLLIDHLLEQCFEMDIKTGRAKVIKRGV